MGHSRRLFVGHGCRLAAGLPRFFLRLERSEGHSAPEQQEGEGRRAGDRIGIRWIVLRSGKGGTGDAGDRGARRETLVVNPYLSSFFLLRIASLATEWC